MTTMSGLRPLSEAEREAVSLHMQKIPVGIISSRTDLSAAQIAAAVDQARVLAQASAASLPDASVKPRAPAPVAFQKPEPATVAELDAPVEAAPIDVPVVDRSTGDAIELDDEGGADWCELVVEEFGRDEPPAEEDRLYIEEPDFVVPDGPIAALLSRAEASLQPRVRQLAASIRTQLAELEQMMGQDEQVRVLTATALVLRRQLADTEAQLAGLLGTEAAAPPPAPAVKPKAAVETEQEVDDSTLRKWGEANGWDVKPVGRVRNAVRLAYNQAHGRAS